MISIKDPMTIYVSNDTNNKSSYRIFTDNTISVIPETTYAVYYIKDNKRIYVNENIQLHRAYELQLKFPYYEIETRTGEGYEL